MKNNKTWNYPSLHSPHVYLAPVAIWCESCVLSLLCQIEQNVDCGQELGVQWNSCVAGISLLCDPRLSSCSHFISTYCYIIAEYTLNLVCICGAFIHCLQSLEIFSGTRLIRPAALGKPAPQTESCLATPKKSEGTTEADSCAQVQNVGTEFQNNIHNVFMFCNYILKLNYK